MRRTWRDGVAGVESSRRRLMVEPKKRAGGAGRRTQEERSRSTKEKLMASGIDLLKQRRYVGLRTAEVAAMAGLSKGAHTHHYPTKEALVVEVLEEIFRRTQARAQGRIDAANSARAGLLHALVEDAKEFFLGDDFLVTLDLLMVAPEESLGMQVKKLAQQYRYPVEKAWVAALVAAGHPRSRAESVVALTYSIARGLGIRQLMSGTAAGLSGLMREWTSLADRMLNESATTKPRASRPARRGATQVNPK